MAQIVVFDGDDGKRFGHWTLVNKNPGVNPPTGHKTAPHFSSFVATMEPLVPYTVRDAMQLWTSVCNLPHLPSEASQAEAAEAAVCAALNPARLWYTLFFGGLGGGLGLGLGLGLGQPGQPGRLEVDASDPSDPSEPSSTTRGSAFRSPRCVVPGGDEEGNNQELVLSVLCAVMEKGFVRAAVGVADPLMLARALLDLMPKAPLPSLHPTLWGALNYVLQHLVALCHVRLAFHGTPVVRVT